MVKIICDDCEREVVVSKYWDNASNCNECGGTFSETDTEDYEEEDEEEDDESEDECVVCDRSLQPGKFCKWEEEEFNGAVFKNWNTIEICHKCIEKKYKVSPKVIEKEVIKFIHRTEEPEITKPTKQKQIFNSVL